MPNTSLRPMPKSDQPPTIVELAIMRDSDLPDVPTDSDVLSLFEGPIKAMREQAQLLIKRLNNNRNIDVDLWHDLSQFAGDVLNSSDPLCCLECLRVEDVKLGRGNGFDGVLCDRHIDELLGSER